MDIEIEFREHPARAQHPVTKKLLDQVHPAVADWRAVYLLCPGDTEDMFLGYITPNEKLHLVVSSRSLGGREMAELIRRRIAEQAGVSGDGPTIADPPNTDESDQYEIKDELE